MDCDEGNSKDHWDSWIAMLDEKPGSRNSHTSIKFGKKTTKTLRYCKQCQSKTVGTIHHDIRYHGTHAVQYSVNKKYRFDFVDSLDQEVYRQHSLRDARINGRDFAAQGNCGSYACGTWRDAPVLPKGLPRNRPEFIRKPPIFPVRITHECLLKAINGTFDSLEIIENKENYSNEDHLCYLLDDDHACRHQYLQTRQDCFGGAIANAEYGQDGAACGMSFWECYKGKTCKNHVFVYAGKKGPEWCLHGKQKRGRYSHRTKQKQRLHTKKQNRKGVTLKTFLEM